MVGCRRGVKEWDCVDAAAVFFVGGGGEGVEGRGEGGVVEEGEGDWGEGGEADGGGGGGGYGGEVGGVGGGGGGGDGEGGEGGDEGGRDVEGGGGGGAGEVVGVDWTTAGVIACVDTVEVTCLPRHEQDLKLELPPQSPTAYAEAEPKQLLRALSKYQVFHTQSIYLTTLITAIQIVRPKLHHSKSTAQEFS